MPPPPGSAADNEKRSDADTEPVQTPVDLSRTWNFARRSAPVEPRYVRTTAGASTPMSFGTTHPVGFYSGVSVAGGRRAPRTPDAVGTTPVVVTWAGFERAGEDAQVFVQLNGVAPYTIEQERGRVRVRIAGARVSSRNNLRPLDLRFFPTPVHSVVLKPMGADLVVTVTLKRPVTPDVTMKPTEDGYSMLVLRFPGSSTPTTTPASSARAVVPSTTDPTP